MKIASVDKSAKNREKLTSFLEESFESCRSVLGFLRIPEFLPLSTKEVLLSKSFEAIVVGPSFSEEETFYCCRELRESHPQVPIFLVLDENAYTLKNLKRYQKVATDIFSTTESPQRLVHQLCKLEEQDNTRKLGKLLTLNSAKGGVGTTSLVTAFAHAALALEKKCIVLDLSPNSALLHYLSAPRFHSPEFTAALLEDRRVDPNFVKQLKTVTPCGIEVILPPYGSKETREKWLRNPGTLELSLNIIEILRDEYELIIIDVSTIEGILPFAINSRANYRYIVTANEPASVFLLNNKLSEISEIPGNANTYILINELTDQGLNKKDISDFLLHNKNFTLETIKHKSIPLDTRGKFWIGTRNSFYTESKRSTQGIVEEVLKQSLGILGNNVLEGKISLLEKIISFFRKNEQITSSSLISKSKAKFLTSNRNLEPINNLVSEYTKSIEDSRIRVRGSMTLEALLSLSAAIIFAVTTLPFIFTYFSDYISGFSETTTNNNTTKEQTHEK
ncbi:MAG: hypothetical protein KBC84_05940 [Proteobacteria bacterium]|nr:hypothetical protein [Pseudomonadota bacterium]